MTIEQKAKTYDEALEKAKNLQHDNAWVTTIFPELKESKDDKMRKAALKGIEYLERNLGWDAIDDTDILDVKEYLEKQKEHLTPEEKMNHPLYLDGFDSGRRVGEAVAKSAEWSYPYGRNETADRLVSIAECLEMDGDCLFNEYSGTECGEFLRELARKQIECKPAEWSEEDEKMFENFMHKLEVCDLLTNKEIRWAKLRFKSLRPQPHWKPSKEQMDALMLAIEGKWDAIKPTGYMSRRLEDLYEGLANTFGVECNLEK